MRKVIKPIILAVFLLVFLSSFSKKMTVNNYQTVHVPAGTKELAINLYCDETEVTNQFWLDYLHWTKLIYGANSDEYKLAMPDTTVWNAVYPDSIAWLVNSDYFLYPAYRNYPIVGVSQQQAKEYAKWRSDRVFEYILITVGVIGYTENPTKDNHFTIERYFNGEVKKLKDVNIAYYPEYRLPNLIERQYITTYTDYLNYKKEQTSKGYKKKCKKCLEHFPAIWSDISVKQKTSFNNMESISEMKKNIIHLRVSAMESCPSYIYHLRGNVAEWLDEPNITAGGSWHDKLEDIMAFDISSCNNANAWTGFRCVCQWKKWENKSE